MHHAGKGERDGTMPAGRPTMAKGGTEAPQDEFTKKTFTATQKILREQRYVSRILYDACLMNWMKTISTVAWYMPRLVDMAHMFHPAKVEAHTDDLIHRRPDFNMCGRGYTGRCS
jgi:hypothetical protein